LFKVLSAKTKQIFTYERYHLRVYSDDPEFRFRESKNYLDPNLPVKSIPVYDKAVGIELEIFKKKFADDPNDQHRKTIFQDMRDSNKNMEDPGTVNDEMILYNDVSANQYEEFEVIKINNEGKR